MRISDWSSDVCSSDLRNIERIGQADIETTGEIKIDRGLLVPQRAGKELGRACFAETGVVAVADVEIEIVTAVAHAQIETPASGIAAKTAECRKIGRAHV